MLNVELAHLFAGESGHVNTEHISNEFNELIKFFSVIEQMRLLNLDKLD